VKVYPKTRGSENFSFFLKNYFKSPKNQKMMNLPLINSTNPKSMIVQKKLSKILLSTLVILALVAGNTYAQSRLTNNEIKLLKSTTYFYYTNADLNKMSKALLNDVIVVLKKHPNLKLKIEGHSCNTGETEEINQGISEKRANVVKNYLVKHGIDSKRFQTQGYGYPTCRQKQYRVW
jgi:outer membrane protein OmpA-like peptidoglycan-associated protein